MTLDQLTAFLGWCTVVNVALLLFATVMLGATRSTVTRWHARMFGLGEDDLARIYFNWLAGYKLLIYVFNLVPWLVLEFLI